MDRRTAIILLIRVALLDAVRAPGLRHPLSPVANDLTAWSPDDMIGAALAPDPANDRQKLQAAA